MSASFRPRLLALAVCSVVLAIAVAPRARAADALPYSKGFLVTGGYVAAGVDLTPQQNPIDKNGFSTGTIHISGIPTDADIIAAYVYWETITPSSALSAAAGAAFRGNTILLNDLMAVKKSSQALSGPTAACFSSGTPLTATIFRADVLRWLPIRVDKDNKPTGKRLVNDADLLAHGLPLHQIKLPVRQGNQVPESAGATLVIVYRDPSQPLRKIVLYDGIHIQSSLTEVTTQTLQGFYKSAAVKSAQITHVIASGQPNKNERIFFDDGTSTQISPPDPVSIGAASQRGWSTLTYDVSALMKPGNNSAGGYGETAKTTIDHTKGGAYDCLTMAAVIFSTAVADIDKDGLPDGLEDAAAGLKDPDGQLLPNLNAMGANSSHKDIFIEFNAMWAPPRTSYGGAHASYNSKTTTVTDANGHTHVPTPDTLKLVGDAYFSHGIVPHFDVGNIGAYHALGMAQHVDWVDDYTSPAADAYLVPSAYARGGEVIKEVACNPAVAACQFPDFPGTVGWKLGLEMYRDQPVGDDGAEISLHPGDPNYFNWNNGTHRRRFDRNRFSLFHYLLYAHDRGNPASDFPCLFSGVPAGYPAGKMTCDGGADNPDFHHPTTSSGVSDLPGANALVTLGLWDDFVGRPFVRASTTLHELGHNLNLWHGGFPIVWGNLHPLVGKPTSTYLEPNCKPNYPSSMSYLFQVLGLFDKFDNIHLDYSDRDYSNSPFNSLNETTSLGDVAPPDSPAMPAKYKTAWFAPLGSPIAVAQGAAKASRFCDGSSFNPNTPPAAMARVHADDVFSPIHWDGNPNTNQTSGPENVNFDATSDGTQTFSTALRGFNDWANIRLDQLDAGRTAVKFQDGPIADFGSGDFLDFGSGVFLNESSGDFLDFGSGDFLDFGSGDFLDFGSGDFLDFGTGTVRQELDFDTTRALGSAAPYALTACIVGRDAGCTAAAPFTPQYHRDQIGWSSTGAGHVFQYLIQRKQGDALSANPYLPVGASPTKSFIDSTELPNNVQFTYQVKTEYDDDTPHTFSPWSEPITIGAVNDTPTANNDTFNANEDTSLTTANVLTNDTDDDSNHAGLRAVLVSGPTSGTLFKLDGITPLNVNSVFDGSFTFKPAADFEGGPVTFTYKANDGTWTDGITPMSGDSSPATVTINVVSRHTTTTISSNNNPSEPGAAITLTATVTPDSPQLGTPSGTVVFKDTFNGVQTTLGSLPLVGGAGYASATFNTSSLAAGTHSVIAVYCGDSTTYCSPDTNFYGSVSASLVQYVGVFVIPPPPSVKVDDLTSNTHMFMFVEKTNFVLTSPVSVDISVPGTVYSGTQLTTANIPAGTLVNSTYLHHDQTGSAQNYQSASITFATDVLGIIAIDTSMVSSDAQLGVPTTSYQTPASGQGYEFTTGGCSAVAGKQDQIILSADQRTITVCTNVYGEPDDVRVITKGVPGP